VGGALAGGVAGGAVTVSVLARASPAAPGSNQLLWAAILGAAGALAGSLAATAIRSALRWLEQIGRASCRERV